MATFSKQKLTGSTDGQPISVTGTATGSSVTIHTAHATNLDEIWLYVSNIGSSEVKITFEMGTTDEDQHIVAKIPAESIHQVVPGTILTNSKVVKAFAGTANVLNVVGWVNRIA
jgi:predicted RNA-binding protein with EMAP domain